MAQDPWAQFRVQPTQAAAQPAMPAEDPIIRPVDPYKAASESRAQQDQAFQARALQLQEAEAERKAKEALLKQQGDPGPGYRMQPDGTAAPIPGGKADTVAEQGRNALGLLKAAGVNIETGDDPVASLISGSTSGGLEKAAAGAYGFMTGDATDGMENIGKLQTIASDLTLQMTGGSLGAQVSNTDRDFIVQRIGNIADASVPADQRLAAWEQVKKRMAAMAGVELPEPGLTGSVTDDRPDEQGLSGVTVTDTGGNSPTGGGGGFLSQLGQGIAQGTGDLVEGAGDIVGLVGNPLNATINAATGSNLSTDLGKSLRDALGLPENQNKTASAINQGAMAALGGAGLARGAASAVTSLPVQNALMQFGRTPIRDAVAGAAAGGASQLAEQGGAGPVGQVGAALAGGMAGYAGAGAAANRLMGQRVPNALMQAADDLNVQMLPADVGGVATRMATGGFGRTLGGIPIAESAQKSIESAAMARNRIAGAVGDATDNTGAGQAAKRGFDNFTKSSKERADTLYGNISVPAESAVVLNNTRQALGEVTQGLKSNPELSKLWTNHPRLRASLEALTPTDTSGAGQVQFRVASQKLTSAQDAYDQLRNQVVAPERLAQARKAIDDARAELDNAMITANRPPEGGQLSWKDMNRFRSIVGEIIGQPGVKRDGSDITALRKLYGALTTDMEATAAQAGPRALQQFRRANQYWRGREARINDVFATLLGKDGNRSDEAVFKQINTWAQGQGGDFKRIAQTIRSMPQDEADTIRATIVQRMGLAPARRQDVTQEVFSPAEFAAQWNGMAPRAKAVLFPNQQHRQDLDKLAMLMDGMKKANEYQNFSNTSLGVNVTAHGTLAYANFPAAAALALGQFGAGKLLASPRFARAIASSYKLPDQAAARKLSEQVKVIAAREPLIANDARAVADYINKSLPQSPVRAAASEEEQNGRRIPPQQ